MDPVDRDLEKAEMDASPQRFNSAGSGPTTKQKVESTATGEPIERVASGHSAATSSSQPSVERREIGMERATTQRDILPELEHNETHMSRIQTQRSQHSGTVGARLRSRKSKAPLPSMGAGKPYPPSLPEREEYVVEFDGVDDPLHAQNWPMKRKLLTGAMLAYTTFTAAFASSIFSAAIPAVAAHFHVGREVGVLGTSFYVLGG
jgi:MFS transporter, DHA1 family, multidrug resistance protein